MARSWRVCVTVAFVGFRCVGEELTGGFEHRDGFVEKYDWFQRARRKFEETMLSGFFFWPPIRRKIPRFGRVGGNGPLRERKDSGANDGSDGALRARVKFANGLNGVAEQFDADGARRFRREKVHDTAALRELAGHLHHFRT